MDKRILKKISKEWCKGILLACESDAFGDLMSEGVLTPEEVDYIIEEAMNTAERIFPNKPQEFDVEKIVSRYYELK